MAINKRYHYTGSGLDNIWLLNGYKIHDTPYGEGVMIHNPEGLHRAIALDLVKQETPLSGAGFRFLRKEMNLSQPVLGELLGVSEQTVANYEKGKRKRGLPKADDALLRLLYMEYIDRNSQVTRMVKRIVDLGKHRAAAGFRLKNGRWWNAPALAIM